MGPGISSARTSDDRESIWEKNRGRAAVANERLGTPKPTRAPAVVLLTGARADHRMRARQFSRLVQGSSHDAPSIRHSRAAATDGLAPVCRTHGRASRRGEELQRHGSRVKIPYRYSRPTSARRRWGFFLFACMGNSRTRPGASLNQSTTIAVGAHCLTKAGRHGGTTVEMWVASPTAPGFSRTFRLNQPCR